MTANEGGELFSRPLKTVRVLARKKQLAHRVLSHGTESALTQCTRQAPECTKSADSPHSRRGRSMVVVLGQTDIDNAVRAWLSKILENHSVSQVSRWMGYERSRTQLRGYMAREDLGFRVEWIAQIAAGLGISTADALTQIRDCLIKLPARQESPLPGKRERQVSSSEHDEARPSARGAKKAV
jgi:hypothetical protein